MKIWEIRVKKYMDREEVLTENANKLYGIVIGKCTPPLTSTIKHDAEVWNKVIGLRHLMDSKKDQEDDRRCGHESESCANTT